jgi:hypothetical protein
VKLTDDLTQPNHRDDARSAFTWDVGGHAQDTASAFAVTLIDAHGQCPGVHPTLLLGTEARAGFHGCVLSPFSVYPFGLVFGRGLDILHVQAAAGEEEDDGAAAAFCIPPLQAPRGWGKATFQSRHLSRC